MCSIRGGKILLNLDTDLECQLKTIMHECFHIFQQDYEGEMDEKLADYLKRHNIKEAYAHYVGPVCFLPG